MSSLAQAGQRENGSGTAETGMLLADLFTDHERSIFVKSIHGQSATMMLFLANSLAAAKKEKELVALLTDEGLPAVGIFTRLQHEVSLPVSIFRDLPLNMRQQLWQHIDGQRHVRIKGERGGTLLFDQLLTSLFAPEEIPLVPVPRALGGTTYTAYFAYYKAHPEKIALIPDELMKHIVPLASQGWWKVEMIITPQSIRNRSYSLREMFANANDAYQASFNPEELKRFFGHL